MQLERAEEVPCLQLWQTEHVLENNSDLCGLLEVIKAVPAQVLLLLRLLRAPKKSGAKEIKLTQHNCAKCRAVP